MSENWSNIGASRPVGAQRVFCDGYPARWAGLRNGAPLALSLEAQRAVLPQPSPEGWVRIVYDRHAA